MPVKDKSIIITGGGSGIGAAAVRLAAQSGALVTIADVDVEGGEAVLAELRADGADAQFIRTDISQEEDVRAMVGAAVSRFGAVHCAFNNAGIPAWSHQPGVGTYSLLADLPLDAFSRGMAINATGTFLCMKYELQAMLETGGGAIVNTASNAGILAIEAAADYVAAKHAVIGLTKAAALDYAKRNIRVNAVLPGVIRTQMMEISFAANPQLVDWATGIQPNGRLGVPDEVASAALWLLSDASSFVTGVSLPVDGGYSMV